jgi:RecB family exonuclease
MIFLGWNQPFLHATADWLLDTANVAEAPDLSGVVVVVRGRRAGRRLLELLALKCAERGIILVPPEIVTPSTLVTRLTQPTPNESRVAAGLASALAWAEAIGETEDSERDKLFRRPGDRKGEPGLRSLLGLGRHLNQLWSEIGGAGLHFRDVIRVLSERFPHVADFEIPRWEVLGELHRRAGEILESHGLMDETDFLLKRARRGEIKAGQRVVLVGVAEMPRIVRDFLARLSPSATALIFAPESERDGFEEPGILRADYWQARCAGLDAGQIHLAERDRDQAVRVARIVRGWRDAGVSTGQMTVAVPDAAALPRLRETIETEQFETRWAQGRPTSDAPAFQLLRLVAEYLDHDEDEPARYDAVAALVRHPDLPGMIPADWSALDRFATKHLPDRFDPGSLSASGERVQGLQQILDRLVDLNGGEISPVEAAEWTFEFLRRIYGDREENATSPEGRITVNALQTLRDVISETMLGRLPWPTRVRPADFLFTILDFLGEQPVPEPSAPDAIQIVGWLELIEDDAPAVVVASFYEGAVPESVLSDPFIPGSLRQALALSDNAMRMARDAYALAAILGSRAQGRGVLALVAPRFDSADNPVRPSRLLLAGLQGEALARRIWYLAGRHAPEPQLALQGGTGFPIPEVRNGVPIERIRVTAFRDYLESPRKFYFLHVLDLQAEDDEVLELDGADVGTLIHEVLASFGANASIRESLDREAIQSFVFAEFERVTRERFGRWVQPAVELQLDEVRRRLSGFVRTQISLREEGWTIRYVEGETRLECELPGEGVAESLRITGKIDRIDYHAVTQKWRIIDYKTSARGGEPYPEHRRKSGEWKDLQLPLYLKLAAQYASREWGVELTPENCELTYFLLPEDDGSARISQPFPTEIIEEAWAQAAEIVAKILRGEFQENPVLRMDRNDPALLALCGQVGIVSSDPEGSGVAVLPA